jgi:hypothetical protein
LSEIKEYVFSGTLKFPFITSPNKKYEKYSTNFYPDDASDRKKIKDTGTKCGVKEDNEGELFYTFTTPQSEKPIVVDTEGQPIPDDVLVGNGTKARVKITVEKFKSPTWGDVARTRLVAVVIDELVKYEKPEEPKAEASEKKTGMPF